MQVLILKQGLKTIINENFNLKEVIPETGTTLNNKNLPIT